MAVGEFGLEWFRIVDGEGWWVGGAYFEVSVGDELGGVIVVAEGGGEVDWRRDVVDTVEVVVAVDG